jgi:hypothetical protein
MTKTLANPSLVSHGRPEIFQVLMNAAKAISPVTGDVVLRIPFVYMAAKIEDLISETLRFSVELAKTGATPKFHFILF